MTLNQLIIEYNDSIAGTFPPAGIYENGLRRFLFEAGAKAQKEEILKWINPRVYPRFVSRVKNCSIATLED